MHNPYNRDIYHYGSMREYKHREALKGADWGDDTTLLQKIGSGLSFVGLIGMLALLLVLF